MKKTIRDFDLRGKRVLIRVDFNVPLDKDLNVTDDNRIRASLPTIEYALEKGAKVILMSHLGRPDGKLVPSMSLSPASKRLAQLLKQEVVQCSDCIGDKPRAELSVLNGVKKVGVLENLRYYADEEKNDAAFAKKLAEFGDIYINDAFGSSHRAHASIDAVTKYLPSGAGFLLEKEIQYLGEAIQKPKKPFVAILGGSKVSDKIGIVENLIPKVDRLLIGGAMAYTFFKAQGKPVGRSLVEDDKLGEALDIMARAQQRGLQFMLPSDHVVAAGIPAPGDPAPSTATIGVDDAAIGDRMGLDIGPATVEAYAAALADSKTVVWNGPMGVFEVDAFAQGTMAIARAVAQVRGTTIVGGGDSIAAVKKAGIADRVTHISTGGGASLEFLGGRVLPGVAVLPDK